MCGCGGPVIIFEFFSFILVLPLTACDGRIAKRVLVAVEARHMPDQIVSVSRYSQGYLDGQIKAESPVPHEKAFSRL